jgi:hypothetical protein
MTINETVLTALTPILNNTWAVELPEDPTFPAIVFEIDTQPEQQWTMGGGYDQHTVSIVIMAKELSTVQTLLSQIKTAMLAVTGYLIEGESGDAEYESDASIYAYFTNHVVRLQKY